MGNPMAPKGSVMIFVPWLEVIWKNEWPNHLISIEPEAAAGLNEYLPFTIFGFRQAASVPDGKREIPTKSNHIRNNKCFFIFVLPKSISKTKRAIHE